MPYRKAGHLAGLGLQTVSGLWLKRAGEGEISPETRPLSSVQSGPHEAPPPPMTTEGAAGQQARWKWPPYQP